jgi:hypothetical protein
MFLMIAKEREKLKGQKKAFDKNETCDRASERAPVDGMRRALDPIARYRERLNRARSASHQHKLPAVKGSPAPRSPHKERPVREVRISLTTSRRRKTAECGDRVEEPPAARAVAGAEDGDGIFAMADGIKRNPFLLADSNRGKTGAAAGGHARVTESAMVDELDSPKGAVQVHDAHDDSSASALTLSMPPAPAAAEPRPIGALSERQRAEVHKKRRSLSLSSRSGVPSSEPEQEDTEPRLERRLERLKYKVVWVPSGPDESEEEAEDDEWDFCMV